MTLDLEGIRNRQDHANAMATCLVNGEPATELIILAPATVAAWAKDLADMVEVFDELNMLRSNVVATQSATWSNQMYPFVAILDRAGLVLDREPTPEQRAAHMVAYGGAGGSPKHLTASCMQGTMYADRLAEAQRTPPALLRDLPSKPDTGA